MDQNGFKMRKPFNKMGIKIIIKYYRVIRSNPSFIIRVLALILKQIPEWHANKHKLGALFKPPMGICHLYRFYLKLQIGSKTLK